MYVCMYTHRLKRGPPTNALTSTPTLTGCETWKGNPTSTTAVYLGFRGLGRTSYPHPQTPQTPIGKALNAPKPKIEVLHEANGGQQSRRAVLASLGAEERFFSSVGCC